MVRFNSTPNSTSSNMNQQRKLSRHNSRQSSIGETASVGSTKSAKSNGSSSVEFNSITSQQSSANSKTKPNGLLSKHGSQESQLGSAGSANGGVTIGAGGGGTGSNSNQHSPPGASNGSILNVAEMLLHGVADNEILDIWLRSIQCEEFVSKFIDAGYDMPTISRITPQDLTAIGVTEPTKRMKILTEIKKLNLQDGIPNFIPASLSHWLSLIRLDSYYYKSLCDQEVDTIEKMCQLTWEDFEELGITKLGHQKRIQLAIERVKELEAADAKLSSTKTISEPIYDTNPSQILLVASTENHSINGPIINKQSSTSEISSTGSGSMHSVYSSASGTTNQQHQHYQQPLTLQPAATTPTNYASPPLLATPETPTNHLTQQQQHIPASNQIHNQQQQAIYSQPPPPLMYQQPSPAIAMQPIYQQHPISVPAPMLPPQNQTQQQQQQQIPVQTIPSQFSINTTSGLNGFGQPGSMGMSSPQQQKNRQSMMSCQLPFSALAKLPKHQQQLLQQSSIYATLSRQPYRTKQPPPPVPIRTNSLKTNSLTDETPSSRQQQHHHQQQSGYHSPLNNCHTTSTSSLFRSETLHSNSHGTNNRASQYSINGGATTQNTILTKNKSFSGNAYMEASRARFLVRASQQVQQNYSQLPQQQQQQSLPVLPPPQQQHQQILNNGLPSTNGVMNIHSTTNNNANSAVSGYATTGKDDDFPMPPSPLSITDSDEHDLVSLNSDSNFSDLSRGLMTFRIGI